MSEPYTAYKYLYYRIYAWNLRMWGESDLPQFNALFGVSALILMNIITLVTAFEVFTGQRLSLSRAGVIGGGLALIAIGYFLLVHGGKYRKIAKEFDKETQSQRSKTGVRPAIFAISGFIVQVAARALHYKP